MTCAEFRTLWIEIRTESRSAEEQKDLAAHSTSCPACASWADQEDALDTIFEAALVVEPPPAVAARLRQIPLTLPQGERSPRLVSHLPEFLVVAFIALGLLGLSGDTSAALGSLVMERVGNVLLAISILLDSPLVGYLAGLWATLLEVSTALLLLALLIGHAMGTPIEHSTERSTD